MDHSIKRKVIYVERIGALEIGQRAVVVPLNHVSPTVKNGYVCRTGTVLQIEDDGTTFHTRRTCYVLAASSEPVNVKEIEHAQPI